MQAFSITFFGEWGDKSQVRSLHWTIPMNIYNHILFYLILILHNAWLQFQIATIGLAADENPFGVVLGGIV